MTTATPQSNHDATPAAPPTLAELVARARHPKQPKTAQLEPHREELLRLRRDGDSVEVLATALRGLGVAISAEALRLWLNRQLPRRRARRNKTARVSARQEPASAMPPVAGGPIAANIAVKIAGKDSALPVAAEPVSPANTNGDTAAPKTPLAAAQPARPYVPWRNNFTPLVIGNPPRSPRIARDDL